MSPLTCRLHWLWKCTSFLILLDYSWYFHPAMVHHTDSSGGRAVCHCNQRPGGWPGESVQFKIRPLIFLKSSILFALAWIFLVVRLVTGWTKRSTTESVRCYWRAGQTLNHIASSSSSCWRYERMMRRLCFRFQVSKWRNIEVGDVVRLRKNDFIPVWWWQNIWLYYSS